MKRFKKLTFLLCAIATAISLLVFASCSTKDAGYMMDAGNAMPTVPEGENYDYDAIIENDFTVVTEQNKTSTFSLDRNTASYSLMRRQINSDLTLNKNSVRIEEYINYFNYDYPRPQNGAALELSHKLFDCPWNDSHKLLSIGVAAEELSMQNAKPNNLVFLLDVSGSMNYADRLPLIQQAFTMLLEHLNNDDTISIVTYAGSTEVLLDGARGTEKTRIAAVLSDLQAYGSTAGASGIQLAYSTAQKYYSPSKNNRVILATDGDFNVGISNKNQLKRFIAAKRDTGIFLSVLGVGMDNTSDTTMKTLAENGNGNYAYLDSVAEARKVLVTELGGTMNVVAKNAKINVTFNGETVEKFRLIGYESKMMSVEDFENDQKDAGEIGSGHTVTALYEIELKDGALSSTQEIANAELRYQTPEIQPQNLSITRSFLPSSYSQTPDEDGQFIACVGEFGLILRDSLYKGEANFDSVIFRLENISTLNGDQFKAEFLEIVRKAKALYISQNQQ